MSHIPTLTRERDRGVEVSNLVEREAEHSLNYLLRRAATPEDTDDLLGEIFLGVRPDQLVERDVFGTGLAFGTGPCASNRRVNIAQLLSPYVGLGCAPQ